jgi:hypothetical protein
MRRKAVGGAGVQQLTKDQVGGQLAGAALRSRTAWPFAFFVVGATAAAVGHAQSLLVVTPTVWAALAQDEKDSIQKRYLVQVPDAESFGVILDTQGVNESTPGTTAGAELGSAVASATYIDKAINNQNYSAKSHLGLAILGGLLGSALDKPAVQQFHYRYAVKFLSGNVKYFDVVSSDPFRHPAGVCVLLPTVTLASEQGLCTQTLAMFRARYLGLASAPAPAGAPALFQPQPEGTDLPAAGQPAQSVPPAAAPLLPMPELVSCKLGTLAPVRTTAQKCALINGRVVND